MIYDSVLCVSEKHIDIALLAIRSLDCFTDSRKIFIVTASKNFTCLKKNLDSNISFELLDEDKIVQGLTIESTRNLLSQYFDDCRDAGWFLQQFIKIGICCLPELSENYLIWDGDTLMLKKIAFFDSDGRVLVVPNEQHTESYFQFMESALGFGKQVGFSFVSEHLMIRKRYMKELILLIEKQYDSGLTWFEYIVSSLDRYQLTNRRGFSEFETYGNFVALKYPDSFSLRDLKCSRHGSMMCGHIPNRYDLFWLMKNNYHFVSFEKWMGPSIRRLTFNKPRNWLAYKASQCVSQLNFVGSQSYFNAVTKISSQDLS